VDYQSVRREKIWFRLPLRRRTLCFDIASSRSASFHRKSRNVQKKLRRAGDETDFFSDFIAERGARGFFVLPRDVVQDWRWFQRHPLIDCRVAIIEPARLPAVRAAIRVPMRAARGVADLVHPLPALGEKAWPDRNLAMGPRYVEHVSRLGEA
jgi:hypothetical protein